MISTRKLTYIMGTVDQELLLRNQYLVGEEPHLFSLNASSPSPFTVLPCSRAVSYIRQVQKYSFQVRLSFGTARIRLFGISRRKSFEHHFDVTA